MISFLLVMSFKLSANYGLKFCQLAGVQTFFKQRSAFLLCQVTHLSANRQKVAACLVLWVGRCT